MPALRAVERNRDPLSAPRRLQARHQHVERSAAERTLADACITLGGIAQVEAVAEHGADLACAGLERRAREAPGQLGLHAENPSMKRPSTRAPSAASASVIDSAGLWLMPPLQRTKSIAMSAIDLSAMPSWPAPEGR